MITLNRDSVKELTDVIEDSIEYWVQECVKNGELVSGETAWKVVAAYAQAKEAEFAGLLN